MSTKDDGGSAFPVAAKHDKNGNSLAFFERGMTLRDWFAGRALAAIATPHALKALAEQGGDPSAIMASTAYALADAMLAER